MGLVVECEQLAQVAFGALQDKHGQARYRMPL